jgi:hypothetical protein
MRTVRGGEDKREGRFGGIELEPLTLKKVEVELTEWKSIDLHSINSKSTFCPLQSKKST